MKQPSQLRLRLGWGQMPVSGQSPRATPTALAGHVSSPGLAPGHRILPAR